MYVIVSDNGYIVIKQTEDEENAYFDGDEVINPQTTTAKEFISIGEIAINVLNRRCDEYIENGGTGVASLPSGRISISYPYKPTWIFNHDSKESINIDDFDFENTPFYFKVTFLKIDGKIAPVFSVDEIQKLYYYDLMRLKQAGLKVKRCEDCGKAFIANTSAVRCQDCRANGAGERKKRKNFLNNPISKIIKQIRDRTSRHDPNETYKDYFNNLCGLIDRYREQYSDEDLKLQLVKLDQLTREYKKICKYFYKKCRSEPLCEQWNVHKTEFPLNCRNDKSIDIQALTEWIDHWKQLANTE